MLILKEPLHLNSLRPIFGRTDTMSNKILSNYKFLSQSVTIQDLIHMVVMPPEIYLAQAGNTSTFLIEEANVSQIQMELVNQLLNRLQIYHTDQFTYQDTIFVSNILNKIGIKNCAQFMKEFKQYQEDSFTIKKLLEKYIEYKETFSATAKEIRQFMDKQTESMYERYFLQDEIYQRLATTSVIQEIRQYDRLCTSVNRMIKGSELELSEVYRSIDAVYLSQIKNKIFLQNGCTQYQSLTYQTDGIKNAEEYMAVNILLKLAENIWYHKISSENPNFQWNDYSGTLYQSSDSVMKGIYLFEQEKYWENPKNNFWQQKQSQILAREMSLLMDYSNSTDYSYYEDQAAEKKELILSLYQIQNIQKQINEWMYYQKTDDFLTLNAFQSQNREQSVHYYISYLRKIIGSEDQFTRWLQTQKAGDSAVMNLDQSANDNKSDETKTNHLLKQTVEWLQKPENDQIREQFIIRIRQEIKRNNPVMMYLEQEAEFLEEQYIKHEKYRISQNNHQSDFAVPHPTFDHNMESMIYDASVKESEKFQISYQANIQQNNLQKNSQGQNSNQENNFQQNNLQENNQYQNSNQEKNFQQNILEENNLGHNNQQQNNLQENNGYQNNKQEKNLKQYNYPENILQDNNLKQADILYNIQRLQMTEQEVSKQQISEKAVFTNKANVDKTLVNAIHKKIEIEIAENGRVDANELGVREQVTHEQVTHVPGAFNQNLDSNKLKMHEIEAWTNYLDLVNKRNLQIKEIMESAEIKETTRQTIQLNKKEIQEKSLRFLEHPEEVMKDIMVRPEININQYTKMNERLKKFDPQLALEYERIILGREKTNHALPNAKEQNEARKLLETVVLETMKESEVKIKNTPKPTTTIGETLAYHNTWQIQEEAENNKLEKEKSKKILTSQYKNPVTEGNSFEITWLWKDTKEYTDTLIRQVEKETVNILEENLLSYLNVFLSTNQDKKLLSQSNNGLLLKDSLPSEIIHGVTKEQRKTNAASYVDIVHKSQESVIEDEILEKINTLTLKRQNRSQKITQKSKETIKEKLTENQVNTQVFQMNNQEMDRIVSHNLNLQMNHLTDQVYQKLEKRLMNERKRRGY